ncbi:MAG: type II secretion system ATPase GspE [Aestuariibacter sp.]
MQSDSNCALDVAHHSHSISGEQKSDVTSILHLNFQSVTDDFLKKLLDESLLSPEDSERILKLHDNEALATLVVKLGLVSESDVAEVLSNLCQLPVLASDEYPEIAVTDDLSQVRFFKHQHLIPIATSGEAITVAMQNPQNVFVIKAMELAYQKQIIIRVGLLSDIDAAIERLYGEGRSAMGEIVEAISVSDAEADDDVEHLRDLASEAPVIRVVNLIFQRALELRASDIHIEPFENRLKVRYRIDGVLTEVEAPPAQSAAAVTSRVKIMAKLNIAERRLPQDGRVMLKIQGRDLDMRVSTVPTLHGESVVLRLLDRDQLSLDFAQLGFTSNNAKNFIQSLSLPHGIFLVTGPTGSGKSTTLYTALSKLNTPGRKIISVEDPVEYELEGINQIQVKSSIGLGFANALRSIVRQDPDVIMIGEMRDKETANIAMQASLTGHLVLSTVHTNDAAGGIIRLRDLGIENFLLSATLNGIVAQRLVRKLCDQCKVPYSMLPAQAPESDNNYVQQYANYQFFKAQGCENCGHTGFLGRISIVEYLPVTDSIKQLILNDADATTIENHALSNGMLSLFQDGIKKCLAGLTTIDEVLRVTQETTVTVDAS